MKAVVFKELGQPMVIEDRSDPEPMPGEVIVSVHRCGICGSDLHLTEPGGHTSACDSVLGHEISGEIVALGRGVSHLKTGDRIAALPLSGCGQCPACFSGEPSWCANGLNFLAGGYAQYARAGAEGCLKLSDALSFDDGALVEPLAVALHGVRMVDQIKGSTVTVVGCGPIGLGAVFWARRLGAGLVQVIEGNPHRAEMAMGMGADRVYAPSESDKLAISGPELASTVFECVGKPGLLLSSIGHVRPRGTMISLGFCMAPETFSAAAAGAREITIKFPVLYTLDDYRMVLAALDAGAVEPRTMITETVGLSAMPSTFESLRKPGTACKIMFDPWAA
jgi:(R,R)-butanediol dehydrogenase/meso-butanediol dehydrogenase/diacetyl reductase